MVEQWIGQELLIIPNTQNHEFSVATVLDLEGSFWIPKELLEITTNKMGSMERGTNERRRKRENDQQRNPRPAEPRNGTWASIEQTPSNSLLWSAKNTTQCAALALSTVRFPTAAVASGETGTKWSLCLHHRHAESVILSEARLNKPPDNSVC